MVPFLAMKVDASLPYSTNSAKRRPGKTQFTYIHSPSCVFTCINCRGERIKQTHANKIMTFSKLLGMLRETIFSSKTTSNISTVSMRSCAILKESGQINSLYDIESAPVLNNNNKSKGDTHKVIFKTFGTKKI